ncbi:Glycosyltransferase involved in cell wall bisynthesis [Sulfitobacter brevis]|uniref:Glycosyltransferase involved in cell wall bisynthesis n=1 Tax=Sulfitobacter brevis TaxID=74348 RepID=A0A1I2FEW2_9RHOB|nr:glycosyltransferase family 4 protein [Sulfitobacter brevis]SFF03056.1 Glycosyltransferase involved in cell wall bisynthesis [Sulfitobacter brevis]
MTARRKIAVISLTPSPPAPVATKSTLAALEVAFPADDLDVIYVLDILKRSRVRMIIAACVAGVTYLPDLLRGRKRLKYAFFRTNYVFRWIKREMARRIDPERHAFSIQIQSLFDASVRGVPNFIYTDHVHLENLKFEGFTDADLYSPGWRACELEIYDNAAMVFTWSSNVSRALIDGYGLAPDKVACVYTGSNAPVPVPVPQPPDVSRYERKEILFVGVDWVRKGGPVLLEAFRKLSERHPDATLTVVSRVPEEEDLSGVNHLGLVTLEDLPGCYARASVFCLPTRLEPFGNVFVEAMWHQLPVVATRVGALPDLVEDGVNGYLVPPGDTDALADMLSALLDDPESCARMGTASRDRAAGRYDWPLVAQDMCARIEATLDEKGASQ